MYTMTVTPRPGVTWTLFAVQKQEDSASIQYFTKGLMEVFLEGNFPILTMFELPLFTSFCCGFLAGIRCVAASLLAPPLAGEHHRQEDQYAADSQCRRPAAYRQSRPQLFAEGRGRVTAVTVAGWCTAAFIRLS